MKIAFLAKNDPYSPSLYDYLVERGHDVIKTDQKLDIETLATVDIGIGWFYHPILTLEELNTVRLGVVNNHPGFLPWGRGAMPAVWSIAHNFPAGVSMHYMVEKVDRGGIIAKREVQKLITDTAASLYERLKEEQYKLFLDFWPVIETLGNVGLKVPTVPQPETYDCDMKYKTYKVADIEQLRNLDNNTYGKVIRNAIDIIRATALKDGTQAYITENGKRYYVNVNLQEAND